MSQISLGGGQTESTFIKFLQIFLKTPAPGWEAASDEQTALFVRFQAVKTNLLCFAAV